MRFAVLAPDEMQNGAVQLTVDTNNPDDSERMAFQEFMPNLAHVVRQLPGLSWVPDIPRAGSGIMLASFFRVAMAMTDGVADRVPSDFIWQRHPWGLLAGPDLARTFPGVDYLAAYWLGRHHGFITDDTPSTCTAWRTP